MDENDLIRNLYAKDARAPRLARARAVLTDHVAGGGHLPRPRSARRPARRPAYVVSAVAAMTAVAALSLSLVPSLGSSDDPAGNPAGASPSGASTTGDPHNGAAIFPGDTDGNLPPGSDPADLSQDPDARTMTYRYVRVDGAINPSGDFAHLYRADGYTQLTLEDLYRNVRAWNRGQMWVPTEPGHDYMIRTTESGGTTIIGSTYDGGGCVPPSHGDTDYPPLPSALNLGGSLDCAAPATWYNPTLTFANNMPTDPVELLNHVATVSASRDPAPIDVEFLYNTAPEVWNFSLLTGLLTSPITPDDVRSNIVQAMELIPGVAVATDDDGNTVVSLTDRGLDRYEVTVDPSTNLVQHYRTTVLEGNEPAALPAGAVIEATLTWAEVTGLGTLPDGLSADDPIVSGITVPGGGLTEPPTS